MMLFFFLFLHVNKVNLFKQLLYGHITHLQYISEVVILYCNSYISVACVLAQLRTYYSIISLFCAVKYEAQRFHVTVLLPSSRNISNSSLTMELLFYFFILTVPCSVKVFGPVGHFPMYLLWQNRKSEGQQ